jgi:hypothetical protein
MSEWVLVSQSCDCFRVQNGIGLAGPCDGSCSPPIPRSVWDAMVERGARGILEAETWAGAYQKAPQAEQNYACYKANAALRAALGNPKVEGDET